LDRRRDGCQAAAEDRGTKISREREGTRRVGTLERKALLVEEDREDLNACEMKRIKGLQTSRRGIKICGGRKMSD